MFIDFLVQKLKKALKKANTSKCYSPKYREIFLTIRIPESVPDLTYSSYLRKYHIKEQIRILESRKRPNGFVSFSALKTPQEIMENVDGICKRTNWK